MPVLIVAPPHQGDLVRLLAGTLRADGGEVRCYLEEDDDELRAIGCKIAVGDLLDEMNVSASLTNVHTFIPLLPDPAVLADRDSLDALVELGRVLALAAASADIEQTILSLPPAGGEASPVGRAVAAVEAMFAEVCRPLCVLRTGFIWGHARPFTAAVRGLRTGGESQADPPLPVVLAEDLVSLIAAVDDREKTDGSWELAGRAHPLSELCSLAGEGPTPPPHRWLQQIIAAGTALGSSAEQEFRIQARALR